MHGRLYSVGSFPAVYTAPCIDEKVYGDLLTVTDDAIERMDSLEGHPVFFRRQLVTVHTENGEVEAWVYMGPQRFVQLLGARLPRIESGNWFDVQP
jgi:gamma-glutamylcyclotransferase (GGCT)/AIG2-like uncharacterized protein YtfP